MKVKTSELRGWKLNRSVAKAILSEAYGDDCDAMMEYKLWNIPGFRVMRWDDWTPSSDWSQCGPLIDKYQMEFSVNEDTGEVRASLLAWRSYGKSHRTRWSIGPDHPIAACRAIVSALLGDEIYVPDELAGGY